MQKWKSSKIKYFAPSGVKRARRYGTLFSKFNKNLNVEHCHVLNKVKFSKQISVTLLKKSISLTINFKQVIAFSDYR